MTRINLLIPSVLTDQHLIAEIREINQLAGSFRKSLKSKKGIWGIPKEFTLGKGHVKFFFDKGLYLSKRFENLKQEALSRGFNIQTVFNDEWKKNNQQLYFNDWIPCEKDYEIIIQRINSKIEKKKGFYRFHKKPLFLNI